VPEVKSGLNVLEKQEKKVGGNAAEIKCELNREVL